MEIAGAGRRHGRWAPVERAGASGTRRARLLNGIARRPAARRLGAPVDDEIPRTAGLRGEKSCRLRKACAPCRRLESLALGGAAPAVLSAFLHHHLRPEGHRPAADQGNPRAATCAARPLLVHLDDAFPVAEAVERLAEAMVRVVPPRGGQPVRVISISPAGHCARASPLLPGAAGMAGMRSRRAQSEPTRTDGSRREASSSRSRVGRRRRTVSESPSRAPRPRCTVVSVSFSGAHSHALACYRRGRPPAAFVERVFNGPRTPNLPPRTPPRSPRARSRPDVLQQRLLHPMSWPATLSHTCARERRRFCLAPSPIGATFRGFSERSRLVPQLMRISRCANRSSPRAPRARGGPSRGRAESRSGPRPPRPPLVSMVLELVLPRASLRRHGRRALARLTEPPRVRCTRGGTAVPLYISTNALPVPRPVRRHAHAEDAARRRRGGPSRASR